MSGFVLSNLGRLGFAASVLASLAFVVPISASAFEAQCSFKTSLEKKERVEYSLRCNIEVVQLHVANSERVARFAKHPVLEGAQPEDQVPVCVRRAKRRFRCDGSVSANVTIVGSFRVRGETCEGVTKAGVYGGLDCAPGTACPAILLGFKGEDDRPSGCSTGG